MSENKNQVRYLCNECGVAQIIVFSPDMKEKYIPKDLNGLALYSDSHICKYGMLGLNNLYIDHNLHVRSYNYLKLPDYKRKKKMAIPGVPKAKGGPEDLVITQIKEKDDLKMILDIELTGVQLKFGSVDETKDAPVKTLKSDMEMVVLKYYYCGTQYTSQIEQWLNTIIDTIEILPPSRLGVIIEVLRFVLDEKQTFPSEFDKMIVRTILASHEIFFELNVEPEQAEFLRNVYGENEGNTMVKIMQGIEADPLVPMHQYSLKLKEDIVFVIYCFLLLERHGLIKIHRPGIIEM